MGNSWKLLLYYLNLLVLGTAVAGLLYACLMMLLFQDEWRYWLLAALGFLCVLALAALLFVIRKQKFPAAGRDYV